MTSDLRTAPSDTATVATRSIGTDRRFSGADRTTRGNEPNAMSAEIGTTVPRQLAISGLSKTYSAKDGKVLDRIDLNVGQGELVSLLGPSGCGKSTLLRMVAGFISSDEGTIEIAGTDVTRTPTHKRNVGIVHQSHALWPHLTVAENVAFGLEMRKVKRAERERRVADVLEVVGLGDYGRRLPTQLSGGQQQRVALARALVIEPAVLLLDEPLSSLDANLRVHLREEIRRIQRDLGVTTIFVTHDREEAMAVSDRIVLLEGGHIAQEGTGHELYRDPVSPFVMAFTGSVVTFDGTVGDGYAESELGRHALDDDLRSATSVTALVRPDDFVLATPDEPHDATAHQLTVTLDDVSFLGTSVEIRVESVEGRRIEARLPARQFAELPPLGEQLTLLVDPQHVHVFAA